MKQYPLLENKFTKGLFALYLTVMLFLSRDTLFSSCIVGFQKSQLYMPDFKDVKGQFEVKRALEVAKENALVNNVQIDFKLGNLYTKG